MHYLVLRNIHRTVYSLRMELKTFVATLKIPLRNSFSEKCETSWPHIRNICYGHKTCGEKLAVSIERESSGQVTRRDLRPADWWLIWPELVTEEFPAPAQTPTREAA